MKFYIGDVLLFRTVLLLLLLLLMLRVLFRNALVVIPDLLLTKVRAICDRCYCSQHLYFYHVVDVFEAL